MGMARGEREMTESEAQARNNDAQINRSRRMLRQSNSLSAKFQFILDVAIVDGLLFLFLWVKGIQDLSLYYYPAAIAPLLMWLIYSNSGIYRRFSGYIGSAMKVFGAWAKVVGLMFAWAFITKDSQDFSRQVILSWVVAAAATQMVIHVATNYVIRHRFYGRSEIIPAIIVGNSELAAYLARHINKNPWIPHKIVGVVAERQVDEVWHVQGLPHLGDLAGLRGLVEKYRVRRVYFALPMRTSHQIRDLQLQLIDLNVDIIWAPDIFGLHLISPSVKEVAGVPLYYLSESPMEGGARFSKVIMDKLLASIALLLLSPLFALVAIAIKSESPGPILFRQDRHGLDGKIFQVLKFRSMRIHEERDGKIIQASRDDPRVTGLGRFLRRSSIDELPQLINVLKGDMSLVGPRPHATAHNEFYSDKINAYMSRHRILPGLSGLAQVNGCRGETETLEKMEKRVEFDLAYINNWSIWLDVRIMIKTVYTLFSKNVY